MDECPICSRKMISTSFDIFGEMHCPVHGEFEKNELNNSDDYLIFKSKMNSLKGIVGSIRYLSDEKNIDTLKEYGYEEPEKIIDERVDELFEIVFKTTIIQSNVLINEYFINKKINIKDNKFDEIINESKIQVFQGSNKYSPLSLINGLSDYILSGKKKMNQELIILSKEINRVFADVSINNILHDIIYIKEDNNMNYSLIFTRNKIEDEIKNDILKSEIRGNQTNTSAMAYYEFLIDETINLIKKIDKSS